MGSTLSRVVLGAVVAAAVMVGGPASVGAQPAPGAPAPVDPQKQAAARKLVNEANAAYDAKDYDKAIDLYRQAFAIIPHALLMFNVAQSHRLAGRPEQAAQFYERYLQLDPNGPQSAAASAALADIKAAAAKKATTPTPMPVGTAPAGTTPAGTTPKPGEPISPEAVARPGDAGRGGETGVTPAPPAEKPEAVPPPAEAVSALRTPEPEEPVRVDAGSSGRGLRVTGMALGGAGLVSLAVGVYFTTRVLHWEDEAAKEGPPFTSSKEKGEAAQLRGDIAYGLAGALVIGGAVTYWLGHKKGREAQTTAWTPVVGPGLAGIAISGSLR